MIAQAGRPSFFGGGPAWLFYALAGLALLAFLYNLRARRRAGSSGAAGRPWLLPLGDGPAARGAGQAFLLWLIRGSLAVLALGSLLWNLHLHLGPFLRGPAYVVFTLVLETAGGLLGAALAGLAVHWLLARQAGAGSWLGLGLLGWVAFSGFAVEYARLAATRPDWAWAGFLAWQPANRWAWGGPSDFGLLVIWWTHALSALAFIALAPRLRL